MTKFIKCISDFSDRDLILVLGATLGICLAISLSFIGGFLYCYHSIY